MSSFAKGLGQQLVMLEVEKTDGNLTVYAVAQGLDLITPNTTATVVFNVQGQNETVVNSSSSTIGSLAVTLPSATVPGQVLSYYTHGTLTAVVVSGGTVIGAAWTSGAAGSVVTYKAINATGTFIRLV